MRLETKIYWKYLVTTYTSVRDKKRIYFSIKVILVFPTITLTELLVVQIFLHKFKIMSNPINTKHRTVEMYWCLLHRSTKKSRKWNEIKIIHDGILLEWRLASYLTVLGLKSSLWNKYTIYEC